MYLCRASFFFFFFQAEDGIRDIGVTGVQTCALPIFGLGLGRDADLHEERATGGKPTAPLACRRCCAACPAGRTSSSPSPCSRRAVWGEEERGVGGESRFRGAPDHLKKKHISETHAIK